MEEMRQRCTRPIPEQGAAGAGCQRILRLSRRAAKSRPSGAFRHTWLTSGDVQLSRRSQRGGITGSGSADRDDWLPAESPSSMARALCVRYSIR